MPEYGGEVKGDNVDEQAPVGEYAVAEPEPQLELDLDAVQQQLEALPLVTLKHDVVPDEISPARFFAVMLDKVLDNSPIDYHVTARDLRNEAPKPRGSQA